MAWSKKVCSILQEQGHWSDYIDPCSGLAVRVQHSLMSTDAQEGVMSTDAQKGLMDGLCDFTQVLKLTAIQVVHRLSTANLFAISLLCCRWCTKTAHMCTTRWRRSACCVATRQPMQGAARWAKLV